jgi:hypothetical protein
VALNWAAFEALDGARERNFEILCRAIVQRNYGRYGQLRSVRLQPGVEFHVRLHTDCDLDEAGRWFGWQCRWYELNEDNTFTANQRKSIKDAVAKAEKHIPGLTDFVLCLRELPAKSDVESYFALETPLRLHLWADEEIEARLTGDAEVLRATYFDELVLPAQTLADAHERSVRRVEQRWVPDLHVVTPLEREAQIALARPRSATDLRAHGEALNTLADRLNGGAADLQPAAMHDTAIAVVDDIRALAARLIGIADSCDNGDVGDARVLAEAECTPATSLADLRTFARRLRARNIEVALDASSGEAELREGRRLLAHARASLAATLLAIVADAGRGKSHLAAQLTAPHGDRAAGVFIAAGDLRRGGTLDDLASRIPGIAVERFEQLLEALDAAGDRAGARLPIVIDGLNESERPLDWQGILATLAPALRNYPNVLVIVTLRSGIRDDVPPAEARVLEIEWPTPEVWDAVEKYFAHYRINPGSARLPIGRFRNPLFLRMFCEAVNGDGEREVGVEAIPASLVGVFSLYRDRAADRLRQELDFRPKYVEQQLAKVARALWDANARKLRFEEMQQLVNEDGREWENSLVRALEDEGILWRHDPEGDDQDSAILFDAFAGYLIADALLRDLGADEATELLSGAALWEKLRGNAETRHPLAADVFNALVGVVPRVLYGRQLWMLAPEPHRDAALSGTLRLESDLLDSETINALRDLIATSSPAPNSLDRHYFDRLWEVADGPAHRLNARFLDQTLRSMSVATRDLRWTEWLRVRSESLLEDLGEIEQHWTRSDVRTEEDELAAVAVAWMLTSTSAELRDAATRALVRFGVPEPGRLFRLALDFLDVDDPYVVERMLAATYGTAIHHQMPDPGGPFERALVDYLIELAMRFVGDAATAPTSHQLMRHHVGGLFELAGRLHPAAVPEGLDALDVTFAAGATPVSLGEDDERGLEAQEIIHGTDFSNYVVGPLYSERGNYDFHHPEWLAGMAEIRGRVWDLGWRAELFSEVDRRIAEDSWRRHERHPRVERYGKKYGWIAYYELAGRLDDRGELRAASWGPTVWPDIDPTFQVDPPRSDAAIEQWVELPPEDPETWMRTANVAVGPELASPEAVGGTEGPWLLVEGHIWQRITARARGAFGFVRGLLVEREQTDALVQLLRDRDYLGNHFVPDVSEDVATFAGEIPWSARFAADMEPEEGLHRYQVRIGNWGEEGIVVELLGHRYAFSSERTTMLRTSYDVASKEVAADFDLRLRPRSFDLVQLDGRPASLTRAAPAGFEGHLLYLRRDLVREYANGRDFVQLAWGEREPRFSGGAFPDWFSAVRETGEHLWRHIDVITFE